MADEKKGLIRLAFVLCWLGAFLLEGLAVRAFAAAGGEALTPAAVWFHLAAAALLLVVPLLPGTEDHPHAVYNSFLGGWLTLFLPVVGILGSLTTAAVTGLLKSKGTVSDFQVMTAYRLARPTLPEFREDVTEFIEEEINVEPMLDVLRGDNTEFKRGVVKYLEQIGSPAAIGVLKQSLNDASPEIQYYTHAALEKLESVWMERIEDARRTLEAEAEGEKVPPLVTLGRTYWGYANSGLVAEATRIHYYDQAGKAFQQGLARDPGNIGIVVALGQVSLEKKDFTAAVEYFSRGLSLEEGSADSLLGLCQAYFESGDMKALAETVRRMKSELRHAHRDPLKESLIRFWAAEQEG